MPDVTQILSAIEQGAPSAPEQLLPLVYDELRRLAAEGLAHEKSGQTLQATALVHEAYLRLVDVNQPQLWNSRDPYYLWRSRAVSCRTRPSSMVACRRPPWQTAPRTANQSGSAARRRSI